jgi:predicted dehydrogenase
MTAPFDSSPVAGLDRRQFLKTAAAAAAAGLSMTLARPARAQAAPGSANNAINVGLVGVGAQGRVLIEAMLKIPGVRFVAVCDIWEYARTYGERYLKRAGFEVNAYENYEDMLEKQQNLDAVLVATPDSWHAPISNAAMRAGKHVYCEKMMSNTIEGARSMVHAMRETGKLLQIGHQRRSNPRYMVARSRLMQEAKLLGRVTAAQAQWNRAVAEDLGWPARAVIPTETLRRYGYADMRQFRNWRWFKDHGGGPLSDLGAHQIDIFNWFLDANPVSVMASGGRDFYGNNEWMDNAMVIYEFAQPEGTTRAFYQVQTTTSSGGGYWEQFMGTHGTLKMSENPRNTAIYREAAAPSWEDLVKRSLLAAQKAAPAPAATSQVDARETAELAVYQLPVVLNKAIHQPHLENFFNAMRGSAKLTCPADEAYRCQVTVFKAIEAIEKRQLVTLSPEDFVA